MVKFTPIKPLLALEAKKGTRYDYAQIAKIAGTSRQNIRNSLIRDTERLDMSLLDAWIRFFYKEKFPVEPADFFEYTPYGEFVAVENKDSTHET